MCVCVLSVRACGGEGKCPCASGFNTSGCVDEWERLCSGECPDSPSLAVKQLRYHARWGAGEAVRVELSVLTHELERRLASKKNLFERSELLKICWLQMCLSHSSKLARRYGEARRRVRVDGPTDRSCEDRGVG